MSDEPRGVRRAQKNAASGGPGTRRSPVDDGEHEGSTRRVTGVAIGAGEPNTFEPEEAADARGQAAGR
jgi:hypothetical protein